MAWFTEVSDWSEMSKVALATTVPSGTRLVPSYKVRVSDWLSPGLEACSIPKSTRETVKSLPIPEPENANER
jgi:hypothetical protein